MKIKFIKYTIALFIVSSLVLSQNYKSKAAGFPVFDVGQLLSKIQDEVKYNWDKVVKFADEKINTFSNVTSKISALAVAAKALDICRNGNAQNMLIQKGILKNTVTDLDFFTNETSLKNAANSTLANIQSQIEANGNLYGNFIRQTITEEARNAKTDAVSFTLPFVIRDEIGNSQKLKDQIQNGGNGRLPMNWSGTGYSSIDDLLQKNSGAKIDNNAQAILIALYTKGYAGDKSLMAAQDPLNTPSGQLAFWRTKLKEKEAINKEIQNTLATNNGGVVGLLSCVNTEGKLVDKSSAASNPNDPNNACAKVVQDAVTSGVNQYTGLLKSKLTGSVDNIQQQVQSQAAGAVNEFAGGLMRSICSKSAEAMALSSGISPESPEYKELVQRIDAENAADILKANIAAKEADKYDPNSTSNLLTNFEQYLQAFKNARSLENSKLLVYKEMIDLIKVFNNYQATKSAYDKFIQDKKSVCTSGPRPTSKIDCDNSVSENSCSYIPINYYTDFNSDRSSERLSCNGREAVLIRNASSVFSSDPVGKVEEPSVASPTSTIFQYQNKSAPFLYNETQNPIWGDVQYFISKLKTDDLKFGLSEKISSSTALISHYNENINRTEEIISYLKKATDQKLSDTYKYDDLVIEGEALLKDFVTIASKWSLSEIKDSTLGISSLSPYNIANENTEYGNLLTIKFNLIAFLKSKPDYGNVFTSYESALSTNRESNGSGVNNLKNLIDTAIKSSGGYVDIGENDKRDMYFMLNEKKNTSPFFDGNGRQIQGGYDSNGGMSSLNGGGGSISSCAGVGLGNLLCLAAMGKCYVAPWLRGC